MKKLTILIMGAIMMTACGGSSSDATDTTAVDTAVVETSAVDTSAVETSSVAAETTLAPVETTAAGAAQTDTTLAGAAAGTSQPTPAGTDPTAQLIATLGITDPAEASCISEKVAAAGDTTTTDASGMNPAAIKAILACQPASLVELASQQIRERVPGASPEQATCAAKATLTALAAAESVDFSALTAGPNGVPAELRPQLAEPVRKCGLSDADITAFLGAG